MSAAASRAWSLPLEVRDYECDLQGIVNNAVYLHYLEHARHQVLKQLGLPFDRLTAAGLHLVVIRSEVDYKLPLRSGDAFAVESRLARVSPVRVAFLQEVVRTSGGGRAVAVTARVVCAAVDASTGKPIMPPPALHALFDPDPAAVKP